MGCTALKTELDERIVRAARMGLKTVVLMSRGDESVPTELEDISASGLRLHRPGMWNGAIGETWVIDLILGEDMHIHVEAAVVRMTSNELGLAYTWIPDEEQPELWSLLGDYADRLDPG